MPGKQDATTKPDLWKDHLNRRRVQGMAEKIAVVFPEFDGKEFVAAVCTGGFFRLELKDRIRHIVDCLHQYLPDNYGRAVAILIKAAPSLPEFENWALTVYVELFGLKHFDKSLQALKELTKHGTSEFAIRPFIIQDPDRVLTVLHQWAGDSNKHVRRLVAEASRPRGVWVAHIKVFRENPAPVLELLEELRSDPSRYVQKAVANNLNDISKDHPELIVKTADRWLEENNPVTRWIVRHGCRTLIKQCHPGVFSLLGFSLSPKVTISGFKSSSKRVRIGSELRISVTIRSRASKPQKLAIDYRVHYQKSNGVSVPKVFKLAEKQLAPRETLSLSKKLSLKQMTTRRHYPGSHRVDLLVNGTEVARTSFLVTAE